MITEKAVEVQLVHKGITFKEAPVSQTLPKRFLTAKKTGAAVMQTPTKKASTRADADQNIYRVAAVGGPGGSPFELKLWDAKNGRYHRIRKLEVGIQESTHKAMRGVRVTFDNGSIQSAGTLDQSAAIYAIDFHVEECEAITHSVLYSCETYDDPPGLGKTIAVGKRTNGIEIQTDWNQAFCHLAGPNEYWGDFIFATAPQQVYQPVASIDEHDGLLVGVYGRGGGDIDQLGLLLDIPEDTRYVLEEVKYQVDSSDKQKELPPKNLMTETIVNNSEVEMEVTRTYTYTHQETSSWGNSLGLKAGVEADVEAGIPFVAEGSIKVSAEASYEHQWGGSITDEIQHTWDAKVTLPAHTHVTLTLIIKEGKLTVPFRAKLTRCKADGTVEVVPTYEGIYEGITVVDGRIDAS